MSSTPDMVGCQKYTDEQINFVLNLHLEGLTRTKIRDRYIEHFDDPKYTTKKVQYVVDHFGKDPKYGYVVSFFNTSRKDTAFTLLGS